MNSADTLSSLLLSITTFVYGLGAVLYIGTMVFKTNKTGTIATWTVIVGIVLNTLGIGMRWVESYKLGIGHAPLSNLYESLVFFAWCLMILYIFVEIRYKTKIFGAFIVPIASLAMSYAALVSNNQIQPLMPALKSNWLITHVITCFLGYSGFAIACGLSLMYLIKNNEAIWEKIAFLKLIPDLEILDEITHQMIMFGFLFLSAGIITGAVWANSAWGTYWSWDPKETWSLITWLIYASLLHARLIRDMRGPKIACISIIGFMAVMFTYFGVNYLPGLHSYGQ